MLNLKLMYLTSVAVIMMILSLYSHQKPLQLISSKHSSTAFTAKSKFSYQSAISLAGNASSIAREQDVKAQLLQDHQTKFTKSDDHSKALTLPFPSSTLPAEKLLQQQWVYNLQQILSDIPSESPPVHIVAGNYAYRELLLNWLVVAKTKVTPPLSNIIVISIDEALCDLLNKRTIRCLFVDWRTYLTENIKRVFHSILILRLTVIRLLNYWGYDAANIDADAFILKNLEPLYEQYKESDMVAGRGRYPFALGREWGATICGGTFMIKSTPNTGSNT